MLIQNGDILKLAPGEPEIIDQCISGRLYFDGNKLVPSDSYHISERKRMSYNGVLNITCVLNKKLRLNSPPIISCNGIDLFDDYEEGTWTATVGNAGGGTITVNSSNDECTYVKIGRHVFLNGSIGISSVSSPSGRLTIDGKPFNTTGGEGGHRGAGSMMLHNPASDEGSGLVPMVFEDYAPIRIHNSSSGGEVNANKIQASTELRFAVNYHKG